VYLNAKILQEWAAYLQVVLKWKREGVAIFHMKKMTM